MQVQNVIHTDHYKSVCPGVIQALSYVKKSNLQGRHFQTAKCLNNYKTIDFGLKNF